tara:strand:- start:277 stop:2808 length:2532 start_codon:yes stop_codon:yes gene_type:complete
MLLKEGGVGGHMSHLYDNPRLTFASIKEILQAASEGRLEGTEKTDGQNLFVSFSVPEQKAKGVRNKSNIKDGGLDAAGLAKKFAGRGPLEKTFAEALAAFEQVVQEMSRAQQIQIFGPNTNVYFSAEIIDPRSVNLISYDTKTLAIHRGGAEFSRETGDPIEIEIEDPNHPGELISTTKDVSRNAELLDSLLKDKQEEIKNREYGVEVDAINHLKALEDDTALDTALDQLEKEISSEGISDSQTVLEYVMAKISNWFTEEGMKLDPDVEKKVLQKILLTDPSYRYVYLGPGKLDKKWNKSTILKTVPVEQREDAKRAIDNAGIILKGAIAPIESIIHDFSVEMLKSLESIFILDNQKELDRQRKEVGQAIKAIEASGLNAAMTILQKQMEKLKSVENISTAAEGFVFDYDGHTYKFTGNFAPMNQLLGLFKYGRAGIPAMKQYLTDPGAITTAGMHGTPMSGKKSRMKIRESEDFINEVLDVLIEELEQEKYVILIPGGFKPPHKGHKDMIRYYADQADVKKVVVISGEGVSRGSVTREMSERVFKDLYELDDPKIEFVNSGEISPTTMAYNLLSDKFFTQNNERSIIAIGCSDKTNDKGVADSKKASEFVDWAHKEGKTQEGARQMMELYNIKVAVYPACAVSSAGEAELSASALRKALMTGDDQTVQAHLPDGVSIEDFKAIVNIGDKLEESTDLSSLLYEIIAEVIEEKETKVSKAGQKRVGDKIATMTAGGECEDNPKQCAAIAYSYEEDGKLEEISSSGGGSVVGSPGRFNPTDIGSVEKCAAGSFRNDNGECELEEESGAVAAGDYGFPLGAKPKYFNSPRPKVKGIKITYRRQNTN